MSRDTELTPMMAQYRRIKSELPADALLLFRLGDFYELFFEDAREGAQLLNVALTKRGVVPMCGIPYHAANGYIARILKAGRKVAICDQMEEARPGQLVKRAVTQILSPGAHFDERMLNAERHNYLAAVHPHGSTFGLALVDLTTGDFRVTELPDTAALVAELERVRPAEVVLPGEAAELRALVQPLVSALNGYDDWVFAPETAQFTLREHFKVASLDGLGLKDRPAAIGAAGAVVHYLSQHLRRDVGHLTRLAVYLSTDYLVLDGTTLRNLEILEPLHRDAPKPGSLFAALNRTVTPMGARRLRDWLSQPLADLAGIHQRQQSVQAWIEQPTALEAFRGLLATVRDLERTVTRLSAGTGNARDLQALRLALAQVPELRQQLRAVAAHPAVDPANPGPWLRELPKPETETSDSARAPLLTALSGQLRELPDLVQTIGTAIVDEPPLALKEGGLIKAGFDASLDELRQAGSEGKEWIARLQQDEIQRTGIASLKIRFNSVFGYYIEVTRSNLDKVPRALCPQADGRQRRTFHHPGPQGNGRRRSWAPRNAASASNTISSCGCAKRSSRGWRRSRRPRAPWPNSMCSPRSPKSRACTITSVPRSEKRASSGSRKAGIRCWIRP